MCDVTQARSMAQQNRYMRDCDQSSQLTVVLAHISQHGIRRRVQHDRHAEAEADAVHARLREGGNTHSGDIAASRQVVGGHELD